LFQVKNQKGSTAGQKRKPTNKQQDTLAIEAPSTQVGPLAMVTVNQDTGLAPCVEDDVHNLVSNKKQRTTTTRSANQAEAAAQPRQTQ
jgi:hypothetical protein